MKTSGYNHFLASTTRRQRYWIGSTLIIMGAVFYLDQILKTGWLTWLILPGLGLVLLGTGISSKRMSLVVPGSLLTGLGTGVYIVLYLWLERNPLDRFGILLLLFGCGWFLITLVSARIRSRTAWWALIPGSVLVSLGGVVLTSPARPVDFTLYLSLGLGLSLLAWGVFSRLFGLIIPGCLLIGIGPGIYLAWGRLSEPNNLAQTGIMLVCFAFGWGLIILFSRIVTAKFIWWPLIPGSVLAIVGWGLYIGGNPSNALNFIGNTGSLGLIIFGLYLLLWRRGIQQ